MTTIFFSSDHHWHHTNVIRFCNRPFSSVEEMNEVMIQRWNEYVKPQDKVYYLGDFCFAGSAEIQKLVNRLNGSICLVRGNHDKVKENTKGFEWVKDYYELTVGYQQGLSGKHKIILCHFPFLTWNNSHHGSFHLHGHSHGKLNKVNKEVRRLDVGVDNNNFYPFELSEVVEILNKKGFNF